MDNNFRCIWKVALNLFFEELDMKGNCGFIIFFIKWDEFVIN